MREKHAEGYASTARIGYAAGVDRKLGDGAVEGSVEIEQSALVEDCSHGGGRNHFRERREIEERGLMNAEIPAPSTRFGAAVQFRRPGSSRL